MQVSDILEAGAARPVTVNAADAIGDIARTLADEGHGAAVATTADGAIAGILSERDIVRALHSHGAGLRDVRVDELMTSTVITCTPDNTVEEVMALMTEHGIRHIPVVREGALAGIVGILDVVRSRLSQVETDYVVLRNFMADRIE